MATRTAEPAKSVSAEGNGHGATSGPDRPEGAAPALVARLASAVEAAVDARVGHADFDQRDPDYIREMLPAAWLLASLWHRGDVRGLANIPDDGPVLLVGNHSGGNMAPDTIVFTLAFTGYFGVERPFYQLAHNLVTSAPGLGTFLRRFGTVTASRDDAARALDNGAAVLVYPGGDWEVHRPSWESGVVDFGGRTGFLKLAAEKGVPIVPVVSIGGQETLLLLSRGDRLSRLLKLDRVFRLKTLPIGFVAPWGLTVGDFIPHLPFPAKLTMEVLPAIDIAGRFGNPPDVQEAYRHVTGVMQQTLSSLAAERGLPFLG